MSNEPVAWLVQYKDRHEFRWSRPEHLYEALACDPLYTHPAPLLAPDTFELIQKFQAERDQLQQECARLYRIIELAGDPKMNQLIQQLMLEAGYAAPEMAGRANRLAQLIVESCAQEFDNTYMTGGKTMGAYLREKFGVDAGQ